MSVILRDYQLEVEDEVVGRWIMGFKNILAVKPTGAGKSVLISSIVGKETGGVCVIAHRQELVSQMSMHLARDGIEHRVIASLPVVKMITRMHQHEFGRKFINVNSKVAVAGVDTLVRRKHELRNWLPTVGLWVIDEAHHVLKTNKWGTAVEMFPNAKGLGVTATPLRLDGKGLGDDSHGVFEEMVVGIGMRDLINKGYLTDYKIFAPMATNFNIEQVKITSSGEFSAKEVNNMINQSSLIVHEDNKLIGDVVEHYLRLAYGKLGITFVPSMDIGKEITAQYNACGVTAVLLNAKTPDNERANVIQRFTNKEIMQIVNVDILGEGFDLPAIEVVSMARPTNSYGMFVQQFGRVLRILEGKSYGLIIDHVGNVARFITTYGLPDSPKNWSLEPEDGTAKKAKKREINPLKTCESCALVYERFLKACPQCGHYPTPVERNIEQVDGSLQELDPLMLAKLRGDIVLKDRPIDDLVNEYVATMKQHPNPMFNQSNIKKYRTRCEVNQEAQSILRDSMAVWGGWRRYEGSDDDEIFKKFYIEFGIDWLTCQALESKDAINLNKQVVL